MSEQDDHARDVEQDALFEVEPEWKDLWQGMPEYSHEDLQPYQSLTVHFKTMADREAFAKLIGQSLTTKTKSVWHPKAEIRRASDKVFTGGKAFKPRYPVYIISKGRWESRLTSKALEWIGVPYRIVVEPQELERYAAVIAREKILVTPFSNLGQGGIPARNFVWEHALTTGADRHWILDDNISGFCRFQDNLKVEVDSAATFCAIEDWCDRYENVAMAAFNYDYFAPRKQGAKIKPITLNTRCYSGILLRNDLKAPPHPGLPRPLMPHRWRGRYNEDTDLSLRLLKDGWCTALFNAFLMYKKPTLTMKGGNTDELYAGAEATVKQWEDHAAGCSTCKRCVDGYGLEVQPCAEGQKVLELDGRWRMAEHLRLQHPDLTTVERKWRRWQHLVDYRRFRTNELIPKAGVAIEQNDYGMELDVMPEGWGAMGHDRRNSLLGQAVRPVDATPKPESKAPTQAATEPRAASKPASALAFALSRKPAEPAPPQPPAKAEPPSSAEVAKAPLPMASPPVVVVRVEPLTPDLSPAEIKLRLDIRGHNLYTENGRLFVTRPEELSQAEVMVIRENYAPLLALFVTSKLPEIFQGPGVVAGAQTSDVEGGVDPSRGASDDRRASAEAPEVGSGQGAPPFRCKVCSAPSWVNPSDQTPPPDYCHPEDHGEPPVDDGVAGVSRPSVYDAEGTPSSLKDVEKLTPASVTMLMTTSDAVAVPIADRRPWPFVLDDPSAPVDATGTEASIQGAFFGGDVEPGQSLAQFLGSEPSRVDPNFTPDEPPDLIGIDEVVLNFATDGVDWNKGHRPGGLTVSTMDGRLCRFLPFRFAGGNLSEEAVRSWAREQLRGKRIVNSKTKFDVHMAREWGVDLEAQGCTFSDVQHTAALLDDHRKRFAVDVLADDYLPDLPKVARVDERRHLEYHAAEVAEREKFTASLVWRLRDAMRPQLEKEELLEVQSLEDAVIPAVVEMERNGSPLDVELLERFEKEVEAEHGRVLMEVSAEAGFAFDHTAKAWQRLFEKLGLPPTEGNSEKVLEGIDHPLVTKGYYASQLASLNSKTFKAYRQSAIDGVLYPDINQLRSDDGGTVSGRFSIGYVQQVPNHDNHHDAFGEGDPDDCHGLLCRWFPRKLFKAADGLPYLEGDAAQIEFRLLVHYSQNAALTQAYKDDPNMSYHKVMQARLKQYKPDMLYAHTKNYNFAAQYGARSIKLATMMKFITEDEGAEIRAAKRWNDSRLKTINEIVAAVKQTHPEAEQLFDRAAHLAKPECDNYCKKGDALHRQYPHRGYVKTHSGRRSRFPTNYKTHVGLNRVIQGTAADVMKRKLVELHKERAYTGFLLRLTVHDAVGGDARQPETLERVREVLNRQTTELRVPILWTANVGANWAECH